MEINKLIDQRSYTEDEKAWLLSEGTRLGVAAPRNVNCPNCWHDMAVLISIELRKEAGRES